MQAKLSTTSPLLGAIWARLRYHFKELSWYPSQSKRPPTLLALLINPKWVFPPPVASDVAQWALLGGIDEGPATLRVAANPAVQAAVIRALAVDEEWLLRTHNPEAVRSQLLEWANQLAP